ncbi:MAG: PEGA domain-containing protein [Lachnospirales bacterium]
MSKNTRNNSNRSNPKRENNQRNTQNNQQNMQNQRQNNDNLRNRKANEKSALSLKITYIAILVVLLIIAFIFFSYMLKKITDISGINDQSESVPTNPISTEEQQNVSDKISSEPSTNYIEVTGFVNQINKNSLVIYDIYNNTNVEVYVDNSTTITDAYNKKIIFLEIEIGDGFTATYHKDTKIAKTIESANDYYEHKDITGITVDTENSLLNVKGRQYKYNSHTIFSYNGESSSIENIDEKDTVDLKVIGDTCYYVAVNKPHGGLNLVNKSHIVNGTVEVDTDGVVYLNQVSSISLAEGSHRVVIRGDNIEPYTYDFIVNGNSYATLDLSIIEERTSDLYITSSVSDYALTVNGTTYENYEAVSPVQLPYGEYTISVAKENYYSYDTTVTVDSPTTNVTIELEQIKTNSTISIATTPEGAMVYMDNSFIGTTPIEQDVEYGEHSVVISLEGYKQIAFTVDASESLHKYNVVMQPSDHSASGEDTDTNNE